MRRHGNMRPHLGLSPITFGDKAGELITIGDKLDAGACYHAPTEVIPTTSDAAVIQVSKLV